jgi:hypothetical protein
MEEWKCKRNLSACKECLESKYFKVWWWSGKCNHPDNTRPDIINMTMREKEVAVNLVSTMTRPQESH